MKSPRTAGMLSGLLFPGTGQFYLGLYGRGLAFFLPAAWAAIYLTMYVIERTQVVVDAVMSGKLALDAEAIALFMETHGLAPDQTSSVASVVLVLCWILSVIDAVMAARRLQE